MQNLLFAQHVSGTTMPIIRSSRVLYRWLLPLVLGALVYSLLVWCGAVGYVSGLRDALVYSLLVWCEAVGYVSGLRATLRLANRTQLHTRSTTCKPKSQASQAAANCIPLELLMMGIMVPETC
jgi:hypothetical protein